ncbi:MAG: hypothetical protein GEV11_09875 [Streptosporangiales bacterium]|nr:hypothetical protein [Streptosporangiales bacterium]
MHSGPVRRDDRSAGFFDGAARGELMLRRCPSCSAWYGPDARGCPDCPGTEPGWAASAGTGTLVSWVVAHGRPGPDGATPEPDVAGLVELAEGPWMTAAVEAPAAELRAGLPLRARFERPSEGEPYPVFVGS